MMKSKVKTMNIDDQYLVIAKSILENGVDKGDRTGTGTKSIFSAQVVHDMSEGFPLLTTKKVFFKGIVSELLWFLRGETNIKWLVENGNNIWVGDAYKNYCKIAGSVEEPDYDIHVDDPNQNCTRLMTQEEFIERIKTDDKFANEWGELGPIYGAQWRSWSKWKPSFDDGYWTEIDQIKNLVNDLKTNPDSRRLMVNAWNVGELDNMVLPPCHYGFQVYTRELSFEERHMIWHDEGKKANVSPYMESQLSDMLDRENVPTRAISLKWHQRSVDLPLGLPFNIASYALLLEILAKEVNMVPGILVGDLTNVHIYNNQVEGIEEQITRKPNTLPKLVFKDPFWDLCDKDMSFSEKIKLYKPEWFTIEDYMPHPTIKFPLSN